MRIPLKKKKIKYRKKQGIKNRKQGYQSQGRAIKYLGVNKRTFRQLCIWKGIYPRSISNKKQKFGSNKTYYLRKDLKFISHDPLLKALRRVRKWKKYIKRAKSLKNTHTLENLKRSRKPILNIDHCIRERYPNFVDALRDLDDAISLIVLFSNLPHTAKIKPKKVEKCGRLVKELHNYVVLSRTLKKVFLSVKGIYYQAVIDNVHITWIEPYPFAPQIPLNIDWFVMVTYLQFYETLMSFVLYKLYHDRGLQYPPPVDYKKENEGAGLSSIGTILLKEGNKQETDQIEDDVDEEEMTKVFGDVNLKSNEALKEEENFKNLFSGCVIFLSREVPRDSIEFIIKAFGGKVGWEGSGLEESDPSITHQISDRTSAFYKRQAMIAKKSGEATPPEEENEIKLEPVFLYQSRDYVQPQWVYDCVNARVLLPVEEYGVDSSLPPHLSPFVDDLRAGYLPLRREKLNEMISIANRNLKPKDKISGLPDANKQDGYDTSDEEHEDAILEGRYALEYQAEAGGEKFDEEKFKDMLPKILSKEEKQKLKDQQFLQFRAMMIPDRKRRNTYQAMKLSMKRRDQRIGSLQKKRKQLDRQLSQQKNKADKKLSSNLQSQAAAFSPSKKSFRISGEEIFDNKNKRRKKNK